ncbi:MAG: heavy-metal-associated domain-containing protein [Coriobacteriales bacterium]|nr:heavy-metal-associated domain-containing protein [Coriobacteriales bacterium]
MGLFSKKETVDLDVQGMHCPKCVARVTAALEGVEGVTKAKVSLENNSAKVEGHGFDTQALIDAVTETGFEAKLAQ